MRNCVLYSIMAIACLTFIVVLNSCIEDEETEVTPECAITKMSVSDIRSVILTKAHDGGDSTYSRTISGNTIKFNIDQVNGRISSIDSLPSWTDLRRVVPSFSYSGRLYAQVALAYGDENYYPVSNGKDSVDFTNPVKFMVVGSDGISIKRYTISINKSLASADSLLWTSVANHNLTLKKNHKLWMLDNRIYAFSTDGTDIVMSSSADGQNWTTPETANQKVKFMIDSMLLFNGKFYATTSEGKIYESENGTDWSIATEQKVERLLASDAYYIYAYDGEKIIASADLQNWEENGIYQIKMLPQTFITNVAYTTKTHSALQAVVMAGLTEANPNAAVVWYKVSAQSSLLNQKWDYINITSENKYALPALQNLQIFHYNDANYAIGGDNSAFYRSDDNGITWHKLTSGFMPPKNIEATNKASFLVDGKYIWMVQNLKNGNTAIWKGILNKLN